MNTVHDAVRDYELRAVISGLTLDADELKIGPVTIRDGSWDGTQPEGFDSAESHVRPRRRSRTKPPQAIASVSWRGCPEAVFVVGLGLIDAACDLPRAFAPSVNPIPDEIPGDAIPASWLNPWFGIRIGERHARRASATKHAVKIIDRTGAALPPSMLWSADGTSGQDATVDPSILVLPRDWPPPRTAERVAWNAVADLVGVPDPPDRGRRLMRALHWLARSSEAPQATDAQVFAVIAIEALVAPTGSVDGRYARIAERASCLLERDKKNRAQAKELLLRHFDLRHELLHARGGQGAEWPEATEARKLAFKALVRFAELALYQSGDSTADRWYGNESIARR